MGFIELNRPLHGCIDYIPDFETMVRTAKLNWIEKLGNNNNIQVWKSVLYKAMSTTNVAAC